MCVCVFVCISVHISLCARLSVSVSCYACVFSSICVGGLVCIYVAVCGYLHFVFAFWFVFCKFQLFNINKKNGTCFINKCHFNHLNIQFNYINYRRLLFYNYSIFTSKYHKIVFTGEYQYFFIKLFNFFNLLQT